jgi:hypothetical protein
MAKKWVRGQKVNSEEPDGLSELMRQIASWTLKVTLATCGILAYFTNVHSIVETKYGSPLAWTIFGIVATLILLSLIFYVCSLLFRRRGG